MTEPAEAGALVRPTFGTTWRFALAVYWKFIAIVFLAAAAFQFVGYVVPLGTIEFWAASVSYDVFAAVGVDWLTPGVMTFAWNVAVTVVALALQFVLFNLLLARHIGKRFRSTEVVLREAR